MMETFLNMQGTTYFLAGKHLRDYKKLFTLLLNVWNIF